jgi:hypothetical protein
MGASPVTNLRTRVRPVGAGEDRRRANMVPGAVTLTIVAATIIGTIVFPAQWLVVVVAFLLYLVTRMSVHFVLMLIAEWRIKQWKARDWTVGEFDVVESAGFAPADVCHVVIIPNYKEPIEVLERTIDALAAQHRATECIIPVFAMEERETDAADKGAWFKERYQDKFREFIVTIHEAGLPGELPIKAANQTWAAREARAQLDRLGIDIDRVTVSSCDSDSVIHPKYFSAVSHLFAHDEQRYHRFWQAPLFYYNNIRTVPFVLRLDAVFLHTGQLAGLAMPGFSPLPISTYTASMRLIEASGWWDTAVISEDWHIFLSAYFAQHGDVSTASVYLPTWSDIVTGPNAFKACVARYQQILRHDWGAEDVGYMITHAPKSEAPKRKTLGLSIHVLHDHVLRAVVWAILTSGTLIGAQIHQTNNIILLWWWWQTAPWFQGLYAASTVLFVTQLIFEMMRRSETGAGPLELLSETIGSYVLVPFVGLFIGAAPAIHAQTRLLLGRPLVWKVTPKQLVAAQDGTQ